METELFNTYLTNISGSQGIYLRLQQIEFSYILTNLQYCFVIDSFIIKCNKYHNPIALLTLFNFKVTSQKISFNKYIYI